MLLLVTSSAILLRAGPYLDNHLDVMETFALCSNIVITICGAMFYLEIFTQSQTDLIAYAALIVLVVSAAILIVLVIYDAAPKVRTLMRFSKQTRNVQRLHARRHQTHIQAIVGIMKAQHKRFLCFFTGRRDPKAVEGRISQVRFHLRRIFSASRFPEAPLPPCKRRRSLW